MSHDRTSLIGKIQWKTHAKRFTRGFPFETLELYIGLAALTMVVGVIAIEAYGWQLTETELREMTRGFKLLTYLFVALPFLRGFAAVIAPLIRDRFGLERETL